MILFLLLRSAFHQGRMIAAYSLGHQMAFGSWQAKNWDPEVGSDEFDEFCKRINHPLSLSEGTMNALGLDADDAMVLVSAPGFDRTLLNYAAYVRTVRRIGVWLLRALTPSIENPPYLPEG